MTKMQKIFPCNTLEPVKAWHFTWNMSEWFKKKLFDQLMDWMGHHKMLQLSLSDADLLLLNDRVYMDLKGWIDSCALLDDHLGHPDSGVFVLFQEWKQSCCGPSQKGRTVSCHFGVQSQNEQPIPVWVTSPRHCEAGTAWGWDASWELDH